MKIWRLSFIILATSLVYHEIDATRIRYDNHQVYKIALENPHQQKLLVDIVSRKQNLNIWRNNHEEVHVMVSPEELVYFQNITRALHLQHELMISNVQSLIDAEEPMMDEIDATPSFGWTRYYNLQQIEAWLDEILLVYPFVASGFVIGKSYEGRNIRGIKISYKSGNPGIFIESNIHAREWITSATATWFINQLLTSTDPQVRNLAENYDWYIVPVLNVDGFAYTHSTDRMWRKTRQPIPGSACIGADANRNYDSHWLENGGALADPCSDGYAGTRPFSEPEVKALADYVTSIKERLNIMLAFHSYSQLLLSPYGHTTVELPQNFDDLMAVAKAYADVVKTLPYGTEYKYGSTAEALYVASGTTTDWAYNEQGIHISYLVEFRDKGRFGFVLPPVQIIPNCEETLAGIVALVGKAQELGYLKVKY